MKIILSWWKWTKESWRIILLEFIIMILLGIPVKIIGKVIININKGHHSIAIILAVLFILIFVPIYTFIFTKCISFLWRPKDIYSKMQLTVEKDVL